MHSSLATTGAAAAAAQVGTAAAVEVNAAAAAAAVGEALRAVRERVRAAVLRCRDSGSNVASSSTSSSSSSSCSSSSSSSNSCQRKGGDCNSSSNSISSGRKVGTSTSARPAAYPGVRLVAVSKRQSAAAVAAAAAAGQRHFAENYVQELITKSEELRHLNLRWHMIGHLQSNKVKHLLSTCPRLYMVETVDSIRLARLLDAAVATVLPQREYKPLRVLVQVNTSGEDSKSGLRVVSTGEAGAAISERENVSSSLKGQQKEEESRQNTHATEKQQKQQLEEIEAVVQCIVKECLHLRFAGLMTIGPPDISGARQAFATLGKIKQHLLTSLPAVRAVFDKISEPFESLPPLRDEEIRNPTARSSPLDDYAADEQENIFELSMGMTSDFEEAVQAGSTEVRVGTAIFGQRY